MTGRIYGINGPVIYVKGDIGFKMSEMVYVGPEKLVGEVISLDKNAATVQVFEDTTGIRPGDRAEASGHPLSVSLAPGILHNIFDGIERPLEQIAAQSGKYISRGTQVDSLDYQKRWETQITVSAGDQIQTGGCDCPSAGDGRHHSPVHGASRSSGCRRKDSLRRQLYHR